MQKPTVAETQPIAVEVEAGKVYWWCACGRSRTQPFCDGAHKETEFTPQRYQATDSRKVFFCACKHSEKAPLCDGSHNKL